MTVCNEVILIRELSSGVFFSCLEYRKEKFGIHLVLFTFTKELNVSLIRNDNAGEADAVFTRKTGAQSVTD